jgi:hypothetical protein
VTADYPESNMFRAIKDMAVIVSSMFPTGDTASVMQHVLNAERLVMSEEHSLSKVFQLLIEEPEFRTALVSGMLTIVPSLESLKDQEMIMLITYMVACTIAATED